MTINKLDRRNFLKASTLVGGGLMLEFNFVSMVSAEELGTLVGSKELNVFVQIASDGKITIYSATPEMGQGVKTALPMIIAEEMGAKWTDVEVIDAPLDADKFGSQGAGGSTSIPENFDTMRKMGASAREMLIGAASETMEVDREELEARDSIVVHSSGESLTFGQLAALAVKQPLPDPEMLSFKDPRSYTIIGTTVGGVDNLVIVTGQSQFGIDVDIPSMQYASYTRCPRIGGVAISFNEAEIIKLPGITQTFILAPNDRADIAPGSFGEGVQGGVAIVGEDTWSVMNAKSKLEIEWDESAASHDDWERMILKAQQIAEKGDGEITLKGANVDPAMADINNKTLESFYQFPYVAHVCMEPMNCTAHFKKGSGSQPDAMELWIPSQYPGDVKDIAENIFGVKKENVKVNPTRMGGGFGRRGIHDFASEAMAISHHSGLPVKLTWTRTDDIHNDFFRVGGFQNMKAAINENGELAAWNQHYIGFAKEGKPVSGSGLGGNEFSMVALDNARVSQTMMPVQTPCGFWRAPGANTNAFVEQSFLHELAVLADKDHVEFLLELMGSRRWIDEGNVSALNTGRAIDVIKRAAEASGWGRSMPVGTGLGFSFYFCHAAHVAEVAEVSVDENRNLRVHKVTVAVDVGPIINMSGAINQVQGSVIDGLSTMAMQQITMKDGIIQQDNFDTYPVMRIAATPEVNVHFIQSDNRSTGLGEPALPPLAPAVTNAIFAATGTRVRSMPLSEQGFNLV